MIIQHVYNYLFDHNIPHAYEKVVSIDGDSKHDLHLDFCLPNYLGKGKDVYIEHWGFNSDNRDYYKSKKYKIGKYKELGIPYKLDGVPALSKSEARKAKEYILYGIRKSHQLG